MILEFNYEIKLHDFKLKYIAIMLPVLQRALFAFKSCRQKDRGSGMSTVLLIHIQSVSGRVSISRLLLCIITLQYKVFRYDSFFYHGLLL